ncbi:hypothetical protein SIN09_36335, partial [Streptomyces sp. F8]|nr:hypothetical protein [Streptomyces sp. F8]
MPAQTQWPPPAQPQPEARPQPGTRAPARPQPVPYASALLRHAAVFLPAAVPREGRVAFWSPDGLPLPEVGTPAPLTVVRPHGTGVRSRTVPAVTFSVAAALPLLTP